MYRVLLQVFYYRLEVFRLAGVSNGEIATVAVGVVLVAATFFTVSGHVQCTYMYVSVHVHTVKFLCVSLGLGVWGELVNHVRYLIHHLTSQG